MALQATSRNRNGNGANLGYEAMLIQSADRIDQMCSSMDTSEYKHATPGFVFLKYNSDDF